MVEIWCNGKLHYTRPSMDDPDVLECLALIKWHKLLTGGISSYEVREILPNNSLHADAGKAADLQAVFNADNESTSQAVA